MEIQDTDIKTGNVIYAFPSFGWAWVRPSGSTNLVQTLFCRLPYQGGVTGGCIIAAPTPGSTVQYRREGNTRRGYIVAVVSQGSERRGFYQVASLCTFGASPLFNSASKLVKQVISFLKNDQLGVGEQAAVSGLEDQQPGDIYMGDRYGPGLFFGRSQMTLKGSDLSYVQFDALRDKITTLSIKSDFHNLSSQESKDTELDKYLKASGSLQGLGGIAGKDEGNLLKIENNGEEISYKNEQSQPLYRVQEFSGGAVNGTCCSVVAPVTSDKERPSILLYEKNNYDGTALRIGQGFTSIKTLRTSGVSEYPFNEGASQKDIEDQIEQRIKKLNELIKEYDKFVLSNNGIERVLQLTKLLQKKDASGLLSKDAKESSVQYGIDQTTEAYNKKLDLKSDPPKIGPQEIADYPSKNIKDAFTGKTVTRFDNSSIISQDPDGSITIKDGWGSQITMSHGNIYISSALDTFIRPGRDLITMVPRHLSQTANGQVEMAAGQDIKIGAEKNLVMASALNGEPGYTVLENRTTKEDNTTATGVVIRSNGKLSMTSSQDMHIGINDKRTSNKKDAGATSGKGSVYIEGTHVRVDTEGELRLAGSQIGLYAYDKDKAAGIELSASSVAAVSPFVSLDSGYVSVGKSTASHKVKLGRGDARKELTLAQGADTADLQVRGRVRCQSDVITAGGIQAGKAVYATNYVVARSQQMEQIPGMGDQAGRYIESVKNQFSSPLKGVAINFSSDFQPWYNDDFICQKELSFFDGWSVTSMPQMSWQVLSGSTYTLREISATPTGSQKEEASYAYPGKKAWTEKDICKITTVDDDFNVMKKDQSPSLKGGYKVNTERQF